MSRESLYMTRYTHFSIQNKIHLNMVRVPLGHGILDSVWHTNIYGWKMGTCEQQLFCDQYDSFLDFCHGNREGALRNVFL